MALSLANFFEEPNLAGDFLAAVHEGVSATRRRICAIALKALTFTSEEVLQMVTRIMRNDAPKLAGHVWARVHQCATVLSRRSGLIALETALFPGEARLDAKVAIANSYKAEDLAGQFLATSMNAAPLWTGDWGPLASRDSP